MVSKLINKSSVQLIIIVVLTLFAYSNIFQNNFVEDDLEDVVNRPIIRNLGTAIGSFVKEKPVEALIYDYRPLRTVLLSILYHFWGDNPFGYHLVAITAHVLTTCLIYFLVKDLSKKRIFGSLGKRSKHLIPFVVALLFGLHPVHTEAVTYTVVGVTYISSVFFFLAIFYYLKSSESNSSLFYIGSIIATVLAFFTYDITLTLPFILILFDCCFDQINKKNFKLKMFRYSPYFLALAFYFYMRLFVVHFAHNKNIYYLANSFYLTMLIEMKMIVKYIFLLFFPAKLSFIHPIAEGVETYINPYSRLESIVSKSILSLDILGAFLILLVLIFFAIWSFRRYPIISFCIAWFFIAIFPVSNVVPLGPLLSERYLYLPSFAFVLLLAFGYFILSEKTSVSWARSCFNSFLILILTFYFFRTFVRNFDWRNSESLWQSTVRSYPKSVLGNYNLALSQESFDYNKAINSFNKLLEIEPRFWEARFSLAKDYEAIKDYDSATQQYKSVLATNQNYLDAYVSLAKIYLDRGQVELAFETLSNGLKIDPAGYKYFYSRKSQRELFEGYAQSFKLMGIISEQKKQLEDAVLNFAKAFFYFPNTQSIRNDIKELVKKYPNYYGREISFKTLDGKNVYSSFGNYSFSIPVNWEVKETNRQKLIKDTVDDITIRITLEQILKGETFYEYVQTQKVNGELLKMGMAQIPNVNSAYAQFLKVENVTQIRFFLLGTDNVLEVLVYPFDNQAKLQQFDEFLSSIKIM